MAQPPTPPPPPPPPRRIPVPEEAKKELEEIKREILELRSRIEKWAMLKVADVGEMNTVYKKLGILARKLAAFNPHPEAVRLKGEVERLMRRVEEIRAKTPTTTIPPARPVRPPAVPPPPPPPVVRPKVSEATAVGPVKPPGNPEEGEEEELPSPRRVRSLRERYGGLY
jgi:polyhydroxyalkanoate synthesis regulator phasin